MAHVLVFQGIAHTPYDDELKPWPVTVSLSTLLPFEREESSETYFDEAKILLKCNSDERPVQIVAPCMDKPPYRDTIGTWSIEYTYSSNTWTNVDTVNVKSPGKCDINLAGTRIPLRPSEIPTVLRVVYRANTGRSDSGRYTIKGSLRVYGNSASSAPPPRPRQLQCQSFTPHDVAFLFPDEGKDAVLWANTGLLSQVSSTWKAQFASGFAESTQQLRHLSRWEQLAQHDIHEVMAAHLEDSDHQLEDYSYDNRRAGKRARIESREASASRPSASATDRFEEEVSSRVGYVVIKGTPLATYKAVFAWLEKGIAIFGRLSAPPEAANPTAPDAVYTLADYLELSSLKEQALINYSRQLNEDNALAHALGPMACDYDEIRQAAMTVALRHIDAIRASNGPALITQMIIAENDRRIREHLSGVVEELIKAPSGSAVTVAPQPQQKVQRRSAYGVELSLPTKARGVRIRPRPGVTHAGGQ